MSNLKKLNVAEISNHLSDKGIFWSIRSLNKCASTNAEAHDIIKRNPKLINQGLVLFTEWQSDGKGRRGGKWESPRSKDLLFSIAICPDLTQAHWSRLTHAAALGICKALSTGFDPKIKWPNDILIQNTDQRWFKCAGILIENTWRGTEWDGTLVGVGVNVNSMHAGANRRCALGEFTPSPLTVGQVEARLSQHILHALEANSSPLSYEKHLVGFGQPKRLSVQGLPGMGTVTGVNAHGSLELEWTPEGGTTQSFAVDRSDALQWNWLWG